MKLVRGKGVPSPKVPPRVPKVPPRVPPPKVPPARVPRSKWTVQEILCLVEAKKESLEDETAGVEWLMQGAAQRGPFAKWQVVASVCSSKCGARKSHTQCFLKWRRLLKPWRAIFLTGPHHYWLMNREERRAAGLPLSFNRKIFNAILHTFDASDNSKELSIQPQGQQRARKGVTKSSAIDLDIEDLPSSVKIEEEEEQEFLQQREEEVGGWNDWGLNMPSPPLEGNPKYEGHQDKRSSLDDTNYKAQEKQYDAQMPHDSSGEENIQSRVAETSQARAARAHSQHTNLSSQENHVEEVHMAEETMHTEDNDMQDCSTNLRLDKETIGKFLESINSMAKVMEAIVRALTR